MATKKKRPLWMDELQQQPTSGTPYASKGAEQTAQNTQTQRNVNAVTKLMQRGTGSQTTNTGRGVSNGVDVLQRASRALGVREPEPGEHGRIEHMVGASGNSWLSGQLNALGTLLNSGINTNSGAGLSAKVREKEIEEYREKTFGGLRDKTFAAADKRAAKAAEHEQAAKEGLGTVGKLLVDAGISGGQMLLDAGVGGITGTGMLSMGTRTFGDSARQALNSGASVDEANRYGIGKGLVEVGTEKMFDAMKLFGGGRLDNAMEAALNKMAKTDAGRTALRLIGNIGGEGAEETISGLLDPILRRTYDKNAIRDTYGTAEGRKELASDTLYDALVGGVLGALGGAGSVVTGENARKNDALRTPEERDAMERPQRIAESDRRNARLAEMTGTDAESVAAYEAQQNRPRTGIERLMDAANALNAQNAAESPVTNAEAREGNLSAEPQTHATERETVQIPRGTEEERVAAPQAARNDGAEAQNFAPEDHIDNRTDDYIRKTSTKAFQHEHPELHEHFAGIAQRIMEEAMVSIDRGSTKVTRKAGGGTRSYYDKGLKAVIERSGLSRNQVIKVCQDIINDQGSENYADAKRVEMALDALMSDELGEYGNAEYKRQKGEIDGGTQAGSFDAFLKENEFNLLLGEVTEQQLRDEWEAMQANGGTDPLFAPSQPQENAAQTVPTDANGLPEGHGPMSPAFPYREAPTQTHGSDSLYNEEEREREGLRPEDSTHKVNSDAEVDRNANERLEFDYDGEKADLFGNKQSWNDADTALAHRIMEAEIAQARLTGDYSEVIRLQRVWEARGTEQGQALRQRGRFAHTAADIVGEAATALEGQEGAQEALDEIANLSGEWEQAKAHGNDGTQSMIDLILRLNARRRTGGFFNGSRASRTLRNTINDVAKQPGGLDFLTDIAEAQLRGLSADRAKLSPMEAIKTVRYLSMLSKLNTTMRNLVGNTAFDITETVSNNIATPLDMLLAKRTGRRTTALDASWLSAAKRKGAKEAAQRAYIETALDADLGDTSNRFEQRTGRTYKMNGNPVERFLSSMEKWQRYMLTVTDEFAKGGTRAEQQRGIDRLAESGKLERDALQDWAEETAKQRTFQNEGRISNALKDVRNAGNNILAIRDSRGGSFGLGDALLPFAQVPGNVAGQFFNYSPLGLARGTYEVLSILKNGSNTTAEQQAKAVRDFGRGLNGTALTAAFVYLAAKGLLRVAGDDDKDVAAMERDEGISGTQLNIDAALRALRGESTEWRDGDDLMSIGFLEPFNGNMAMGYLIAEAYRDELQNGEAPNGWRVLYDVGDANVEAGMQAVMDLPAMSTLKNIGDAYEYSTADTTAGKVADAGVQFAGDTAASFIPNAVAGIAQGMDNGVVRQTRTSDKTGAAAAAENAKNSILSKIPGARSTLPQALDSWGNGRQTTATPLQNWFNTNILPGSITQYDTNSVNQELYRLMETQDVKAPARNPVREVQDGDEKRKLTTAQQRTYQQITGGTQLSQLRRLMRSDQYGQMRDSERAAAWDAIMNFGKAKGEQAVGGSKEVPGWTEKSDGNTAENAAFYGILQAAKQRLDEDERGKVAPVVAAIYDRKLDEETTLGVLQQHLSENQLANVQAAITSGYDPQTVVDFWSYMNSVNGAKKKTQEWALQNGYTYADFNNLWSAFH